MSRYEDIPPIPQHHSTHMQRSNSPARERYNDFNSPVREVFDRVNITERQQDLSNEAHMDSDDEWFEVEGIVDEKVENGEKQYLIKWKNYSEDENSWQPDNFVSEDVKNEYHGMAICFVCCFGICFCVCVSIVCFISNALCLAVDRIDRNNHNTITMSNTTTTTATTSITSAQTTTTTSITTTRSKKRKRVCFDDANLVHGKSVYTAKKKPKFRDEREHILPSILKKSVPPVLPTPTITPTAVFLAEQPTVCNDTPLEQGKQSVEISSHGKEDKSGSESDDDLVVILKPEEAKEEREKKSEFASIYNYNPRPPSEDNMNEDLVVILKPEEAKEEQEEKSEFPSIYNYNPRPPSEDNMKNYVRATNPAQGLDHFHKATYQ